MGILKNDISYISSKIRKPHLGENACYTRMQVQTSPIPSFIIGIRCHYGKTGTTIPRTLPDRIKGGRLHVQGKGTSQNTSSCHSCEGYKTLPVSWVEGRKYPIICLACGRVVDQGQFTPTWLASVVSKSSLVSYILHCLWQLVVYIHIVVAKPVLQTMFCYAFACC